MRQAKMGGGTECQGRFQRLHAPCGTARDRLPGSHGWSPRFRPASTQCDEVFIGDAPGPAADLIALGAAGIVGVPLYGRECVSSEVHHKTCVRPVIGRLSTKKNSGKVAGICCVPSFGNKYSAGLRLLGEIVAAECIGNWWRRLCREGCLLQHKADEPGTPRIVCALLPLHVKSNPRALILPPNFHRMQAEVLFRDQPHCREKIVRG